MTDKEKLDAIRAEIHRLVDVRGYDREMANDLFDFMDSLPNEPISEDLLKASIEFAKGFGEWHYAIPCFQAGAEWGKNQAKVEIQAQSMALAHGCPKEQVSEDLEDFALQYAGHHAPYDSCMQEVVDAVKAGAKWQKGKDKEEWLDKALDFFRSNYNSLIDGGVIGVFDDKKKMIEEFVEFMNDENL